MRRSEERLGIEERGKGRREEEGPEGGLEIE